MFFHERIKSIGPKDKVLEVGPGGTPHERADVFLDLDPKLFKDEKEALHQRGSAPELNASKPIVYYDGTKFPFKDQEFDYVIASHVLEHVDDVEAFYNELGRVGKAGYIEYPAVYYDYLYNIDVHYNFLHYDQIKQTLYWMKKAETPLSYFQPVQDLLFDSLEKGYSDIVNDLLLFMIEGFEWRGSLPKLEHATDIKKLCVSTKSLMPKSAPVPAAQPSVANNQLVTRRSLRQIAGGLKRRLTP